MYNYRKEGVADSAVFNTAQSYTREVVNETALDTALPLAVRWIFGIAVCFAVLIFGVYEVGYSASAFVYMNY